jgi:hypothetical protein
MTLGMAMHVKTDCKHFSWKTSLFVDMNKVDQHTLREPFCEIKKLTRLLSCPDDCPWFEKK